MPCTLLYALWAGIDRRCGVTYYQLKSKAGPVPFGCNVFQIKFEMRCQIQSTAVHTRKKKVRLVQVKTGAPGPPIMRGSSG